MIVLSIERTDEADISLGLPNDVPVRYVRTAYSGVSLSLTNWTVWTTVNGHVRVRARRYIRQYLGSKTPLFSV